MYFETVSVGAASSKSVIYFSAKDASLHSDTMKN